MVYNLSIQFSDENAAVDPTKKNLSLPRRQALCDSLIEVKQFMPQYNWSYHEKHTEAPPVVSFTPIDASEMETLNYQRWNSSTEDPDSWCSIRLGKDSHWLRCFQCVDTREAKWFVTFGFDEYIYLLEPTRSQLASYYRMTGLFEPTGIINDKGRDYFVDQFHTSKGRG